MTRPSILSLVLATSALLAIPTAASAEGKTDQARKAIAAAQAKIDAIHIVGAAGDAPRLHAQAVAALHVAQDELAHHQKDAAIHDAARASEIADMALAASQRTRTDEQQAVTRAAEQQAADANARAAAAQAAASAAQADAAAARATPPVVVQTPAPAPTQTTVTTTATEHVATTHPVRHRAVRHRVVHHAAHPAHHTLRTTTTVTTH